MVRTEWIGASAVAEPTVTEPMFGASAGDEIG